MKIVGYLGTQRYPKGKNIYDKNGNINENYIFAFDPTNTLGNTKNISSVKVRNPNMALVVNGKVCIDYDDTEKYGQNEKRKNYKIHSCNRQTGKCI